MGKSDLIIAAYQVIAVHSDTVRPTMPERGEVGCENHLHEVQLWEHGWQSDDHWICVYKTFIDESVSVNQTAYICEVYSALLAQSKLSKNRVWNVEHCTPSLDINIAGHVWFMCGKPLSMLALLSVCNSPLNE